MKRLILLIVGLGFGACTTTNDKASTSKAAAKIDGAAAHKLIADGGLLIDVRSAEEYADGHIDGARNIPVNELRAALGSLPKDKAIVVYCAVGARATVAAGELAQAGFDVHNLGAMAAWNR